MGGHELGEHLAGHARAHVAVDAALAGVVDDRLRPGLHDPCQTRHVALLVVGRDVDEDIEGPDEVDRLIGDVGEVRPVGDAVLNVVGACELLAAQLHRELGEVDEDQLAREGLQLGRPASAAGADLDGHGIGAGVREHQVLDHRAPPVDAEVPFFAALTPVPLGPHLPHVLGRVQTRQLAGELQVARPALELAADLARRAVDDVVGEPTRTVGSIEPALLVDIEDCGRHRVSSLRL